MSRRAYEVVAAVVVMLAVAIGVWRSFVAQESAPLPTVREALDEHVRQSGGSEDFVGSAVCSNCHAKIAHAYQSHPMGKSAAVAAAASLLEDYEQKTSFESAHGMQFRVERTSEGISHHEALKSGDDVLYDRQVDVQWAIGSGKRGRSYAFERGGLLFMSPISWYSQRAIWDLSPGYSEEQSNRFGRRVVDGCVACHIGRANPHRGHSDRFAQPVVFEAAIGCERCHGHAAQHVRKYRSTEPLDGPDPIVNPAKLPVVERESICNQCHLQGYQRVLRRGRTPYDFRPGQRLDDTWTVFIKPERAEGQEGATRAVSQVEQMRTSRCYLGSSGQLGCSSCHDPHAVVDEKERAIFYEQRCQSCHETRGCGLPIEKRKNSAAGTSCIECHMPRFNASDIPHTAQTDHRILRDPKSAHSGRSDSGESSLSIFDEESTRVPEVERLRAKALLQLAEMQRGGQAESARQCQQKFLQVLATFPDDPEVLAGLGAVSAVLQEPQAAEKYWLRALAAHPDDEKVILQLAQFYHWKKNTVQANLFLKKSLELNSWNVEMWGRYAQILADAGDWPAALEAAEKGLEIDPSFVPLHSWLANAYRRRGDNAQAEQHWKFLGLMKNRKP